MRRLREAEVVSTTDSDYATLVAEFVSDIHQDVMEIYDWTALRHTIDLDLVTSQQTYDLARLVADGGAVVAGGRVTNQGSVILWDNCDRPQTWIFDNSSDINGSSMYLLSDAELQSLYQGDRAQTILDPVFFSLRQSASQEGLEFSVYQLPSSSRRVRIRFWTPEAVLEADGTDDATVIRVPWRPIYLGTLALALNERGEELGEPGNVAETRYENALAAAIEADKQARSRTDEYEFRVT